MLIVSLPLIRGWCCLQLQPSLEGTHSQSAADPALPAAIGRIRWRLLHLAEHPVPRLNGPLKKAPVTKAPGSLNTHSSYKG